MAAASLGSSRRPRHTFGAGCIARRDASAPSPPHLHSTRALTQRHRSVLLLLLRARAASVPGAAVRARTGPAWSPSSSPPQRERVKARGERSASVDGKWGDCCEQIGRPRAPQASVGRCTGTSWPDLGVRAHLLRGACASRRAAKGARRSKATGEIVVSRSVLRRAWSRPQRGGGARARAEAKEACTNGLNELIY